MSLHAGLQINEDLALQIAAALTGASAGFALFCICMLGIWQFRARPADEVPQRILHGVDITGTAYIDHAICLRAANFAARAHAGRCRKTGDPYVVHCVETAVITEQMMLHLFDPSGGDLTLRRAEDCIMAALLHDIVDDSEATLAEVQGAFGADVAALVGAVAQLSRNNQLLRRAHRRMVAQGQHVRAAAEVEAMKSMILQSTEEPLVIIVKLADRLHNMRTVWALKPEKAKALADETLQVWCPMCEYLGLGAFKAELEDLCFAVLQPETFREVYEAREAMLARGTSRSRSRRKAVKKLGPRRAAQVHSSLLSDSPEASTDDGVRTFVFSGAGASTEAGADAATPSAPVPSAGLATQPMPGRLTFLESLRTHARAAAATAAVPLSSLSDAVIGGAHDSTRDSGPARATGAGAPVEARNTQHAAEPDVAQRGGSARLSHMLPETSRHTSAAPPGMAPHVPFRNPISHEGTGAAESRSSVGSMAAGRDGSHTSDDARRRRGDAVGGDVDALTDVDMVGSTDSDCEWEDCEYDDGELWYDAPSTQQLAQCLHDVGMDEHFRFQPSRTADGVITPAQPADPDDAFSAAQLDMRRALALVIPFRANNFMTRHEDHRPAGELSAAMRFADACASQLMGEIQVEGIGAGLTIQIQGRVKSLYSTHRKMQLKGVPIEQVYDTVALRVVVSDSEGPGTPDPIMTCYRIPPVAYRLWRRVEAEYDDYITRPKGSGYKSIHLAVIGPNGVPLEVQVRTASMHYEAEYGPASHWAYKDRMRASLLSKTAPDAAAASGAPRNIAAADSASGAAPAAPPRPLVSGPLPRAVVQATSAAERDSSPGGSAASDAAPAADAAKAEAKPPAAGQAVICVDEGRICDGVVMNSDGDGTLILVAMTKCVRWATPQEASGPLLAAEYAALHAHARSQGWSEAGQQDQALEVREFRRHKPGTYVYVDRFGHVHQFCSLTFATPREVPQGVDARDQSGAAAAGRHGLDRKGGAAGKMDASEVKGGRIGRWEKFRVAGEVEAAAAVDEERVVRLRAALEWGRGGLEDARSMPASRRELYQLTGAQELLARTRAGSDGEGGGGGAATAATPRSGTVTAAPAAGMMKVMVFMVGIAEVPRGSTAADLVEMFGRVDISAEGEDAAAGAPRDSKLLNVNNELVPEDTVLLPGDLVVLSSQLLSNV